MDHTHAHETAHGLLGVPADHVPGVWALLLTPVALWLLLGTLRLAAQLGSPFAAEVLRRYRRAPVPARAAAWLMVTTASVHLALAPGHQAEEPPIALLFVANAALFLVAAAGALAGRRRRLGVWLCVATVVAYLGLALAWREEIDQLGMATKLVELTALALLASQGRPVTAAPRRRAWLPWRWRPWRRRWAPAAGVLALIVLTGAGAWTAQAITANRAEPGHGGDLFAGMVHQPVPDRGPTADEAAAAARFAEETARGIARFADVNAALADGYRPQLDANAKTVHYENGRYKGDGRTLDPEHPETLVYANTARGPVLVGAMYEMPELWDVGPDIGGPLTPWHVHANICIGPYPGGWLTGIASPFGACPAGSLAVTTPPMIHVWTYEGAAAAFGDPTEDEILAAVGG